jgi:RTX toxin RtxA
MLPANIVTHVGDGDNYLLMFGMYNIATKVGDGDVIVGMFGVGNVLTHVGDGMSAPIIKAALKPSPTWVNILA